MPNWLVVGMFVALMVALIIFVGWEFRRAKDAPQSMRKAVKRYLESGAADSRPRRAGSGRQAVTAGRRAFDDWG